MRLTDSIGCLGPRYLLQVTAGLLLLATASAARGEPLSAFVSIPPQKFFVERVGGDRVTVDVMLPPGRSPHTFDPTPHQLVELGKAQVYFRIGLPFEQQVVEKLESTFRKLNIADTRQGIDLATAGQTTHGEADHHHAHDHHEHGPECNHGPDELDPHIWMDPHLVRLQARNICDELCRIDPSGQESYRRNLAAFEAELDALDQRLRTELEPLRGREFFVFHPAYGYFARAYGLTQVAVQVRGKEPTAKQLAELVKKAKAANVRLIFVQPQFSTRSAEMIARQIDGAVVALDPLAENYIENMLHIATQVREALKPHGQ